MGSAPSAPRGDDSKSSDLPPADARCWLCFGEGPGDDGEPLRRDCSCRGGSGFAHLSCIIAYAEYRSQRWDGHDIMDFSKPWRVCGRCHQEYQNELAVDLAARFVAFAEGNHPGDESRLLESLYTKLVALVSPCAHVKPQHKEEAKQLANAILSRVGWMKTANFSLPGDILDLEAGTYNNLGFVHYNEGTKEDARMAAECFERCREINEGIGAASEVTVAENNIALAKTMYDGSDGSYGSDGELLRKQQELYERRVVTHGEGSTLTIQAGLAVAFHLRGANRAIEAERLLARLVASSERVHGPGHGLTRRAASRLQKSRTRLVRVRSRGEGDRFEALRYEEDGGGCVVRGPIAEPRNVPEERTFAIAAEDVGLTLGTPVVCRGLTTSVHLNGKIGDLRSWEEESGCFRVHFEDGDLEPRPVTQKFLRILFDLPDE